MNELITKLSEILITDERPEINHINQFNDYAAFCDGHILFCIKSNLISLVKYCYCMQDRFTQMGYEHDNPELWDPVAELSLIDFYGIFNEVPLFNRKVKCSECDGNGTEECNHCGSELNCKVCDGDGIEFQTSTETFKEPEFNSCFKFKDERWCSVKLYRILKSLELLFNAGEIISFFVSKKNKHVLMIKGQDFFVVLLGLMDGDGKKVIFER
jgi:hypothetical protein